MKRREFMSGIAAAIWPACARAQQTRKPVIGYLAIGTMESRSHYVAAFHRGLRDTGLTVGRDVEIEYRWAGERRDLFDALATELVSRKVDVLLAGSIWAANAARRATSVLPTVFTTGSDPVLDGLVASYNRPGGNRTGIVFMATELAPKRLELLRELVSGRTVAVLVNAANAEQPDSQVMQRELSKAAAVLGLTLSTTLVEPRGDIDRELVQVKARGAGAVLIANDPAFNSLHARLPALALKHQLPAIYFAREFAAAGGLMSYGPDYADAYRHAGTYVARILKGTPPADLPVMQPTRFELVINLKTAAALGIEVPPLLLARADEVIE